MRLIDLKGSDTIICVCLFLNCLNQVRILVLLNMEAFVKEKQNAIGVGYFGNYANHFCIAEFGQTIKMHVIYTYRDFHVGFITHFTKI